ncbi:hypothetical protein GCM10010124_34880 [Pilimelia terevasa]|uniref:VWFA domain-containing protein n=1 Tax=Pilimelia terevasa TaxID=53372 RepID=A0A8J3BPM2_9ACTN|nr:type II secretion system F family protein [Pilimelia terevasa]GGK39094.1 hypothetical protein GCM10010124_34880 [Pilimelia terevasa]
MTAARRAAGPRVAARLAAAVAAGGLAAGGGVPAAAAGPALAVTSVQTGPGTVSFLLAGSELPGGALAGARITVAADGVDLPATVAPVAGAAGSGVRRAVVLVLDTSGSMAGARIAAARAAAADYAAAAPAGVALGLIAVADTARTVLPPTADRAAFRAAVARLAAAGNTALFDGVARAAAALDPEVDPAAGAYVERRAVVLSDGEDRGSRTSAAALAATLAASPVVVDAVRFGEASDAQLRGFTAPTGGRVVGAGDAARLRAVFRSMAAGLGPPVRVFAAVPPQLAGRPATLTVRAVAGGVTAGGQTPVTFRVDTSVGGGPRVYAAAGPGPVRAWHVAAAAGAALFVLVLLVALPLIGRSEVQRRLAQLDAFVLHRGGAPAARGGTGPMLQAALSFSAQVVRRPGRRERIEQALDRAGSSLRAEEWMLVRAAAAGGGGLLGLLLLPWWAGLPAGLLLGWLGSGGYLRTRANRRARAFADQLPEALQLVVGSLRSGFSLAQAIDSLVREAGEPVAGELGRALAETRLGGDLEDALERVGTRNGSQDMAWLVMAIRIQREVGGNLSETLETAVETMRERGRLFRHVRALSAEGRLSAMVLLGMPVVLGAWMFFFRNEYVRPLYTTGLGAAMLVGAVVMVCVGALWMRKLIHVEV